MKNRNQYAEHAELFPTLTCSLNCKGCSVPRSVRWGKEERMTVEWWIKKLDELEQRGVKYALILGGEPTTYPGIEGLINHIAKMPKMDGGLFTDGVIAMRKIDMLCESGLLELTTHSSVDYLVKKKPDHKKIRENSRLFKSWWGLELLKELKKRGAKRVTTNTVLTPDNLDHIIPVYEELKKQGIMMSLCTFQWRVHLAQGRDPKDYSNHLTKEHIQKIEQITSLLIKEELSRIKANKPRLVTNSYLYLKTMSTLGIWQTMGCTYPPSIITVLPNGNERLCPARTTLQEVLSCPGCHYGFTDRISRYDNLEGKGGQLFPNVIQGTK